MCIQRVVLSVASLFVNHFVSRSALSVASLFVNHFASRSALSVASLFVSYLVSRSAQDANQLLQKAVLELAVSLIGIETYCWVTGGMLVTVQF